MKEILKGTFIIFVFKVLGAISLFLTYILIPRYYGVETFGIFNLIFAMMLIGTVIARIGLDTYVLRILPSMKNPNEISLFLKEVFKIITIGGFIVTIVIFLLSDIFNQYIFKSIDASNYLIGLTLIILPYTYFNVLPEIFRGFDELKWYSFFRNLSQNFTIALLLIITIFTSTFYNPIYILYSAIAFITLIMTILIYSFLKKNSVNLFLKGRYQKKILKHSYPMFLASSIMFIMGYVDSFMISYYLDEYQVGIYNACISLSMLLTFIPMAIGGFISPKVSQAYSSGNYSDVQDIFKNSIIIITIVTIPIFAIIYNYSEFFLNLFGSEFTVATLTLLITNIAFLSEALSGPVGFILNMTDNQHIFMKILAIALLINIVFNALLIPIYGINGAATALLLSMFFWTISSFIVLKRKKII